MYPDAPNGPGMAEAPLSVFTPPRRPRPAAENTAATRAVAEDVEIRALDETALSERIVRLVRERNALLVAHNYQPAPIQDLAHFVGDSLELSQEAARSDAPLIVFCGVRFMAETAAILCPAKTVLMPDPEAGCSLAATVTAEEVRKWRAEHPEAVVVAYINTDAAVKAEVDYCCTSGNAVKVIRAIPEDREILFLPDFFLGLYVQAVTGRRLHLWKGECHVHAEIRSEDIDAMWKRHPGADLLLHPECGCVGQCMSALATGDLPRERTFILGTGGMVRHARACQAPADLVGTEVGLLHRLRKENPGRSFIPLSDAAVCEYMKLTTLQKLYRALRDLVYAVKVEEPTATKARAAITRMMEHV